MPRRVRAPCLPPLLAPLALALAPARAWAHPGQALEPHDLASAWTWDPWIVLPLLASGWLYARGAERLWRRSGPGRGVRRWEAGCFAAGWLVLAAAMVSPLHALGEALFAGHMVQHVLLMAVAAPLLVLGRPVIPFLWGVPMGWRRGVGGWARGGRVRAAWGALTALSAAWLLHAAAIWLWHLPSLYQATLASDAVHTLQHLSFLGTALLFWWVLLHGRGRRTGYGAAVL
ncbi:MAG TPA: cytochrome c oxidase assembly protein, partial [Longimicrobiaceae bacterium]|nr:cytochrome c oxidase assembly protein [Longimicrobiaceae bacterium]